jgi:TfoX/Sxy family transcriptional regulator of competence genes
MAFHKELTQRILDLLDDRDDVSERKRFGGLCFMVGGKMSCGIVGDKLMLRAGKDGYENFLALPRAREMDFTGKTMKGMLNVGTKGIEERSDLQNWVARGLTFASSLPPK